MHLGDPAMERPGPRDQGHRDLQRGMREHLTETSEAGVDIDDVGDVGDVAAAAAAAVCAYRTHCLHPDRTWWTRGLQWPVSPTDACWHMIRGCGWRVLVSQHNRPWICATPGLPELALGPQRPGQCGGNLRKGWEATLRRH